MKRNFAQEESRSRLKPGVSREGSRHVVCVIKTVPTYTGKTRPGFFVLSTFLQHSSCHLGNLSGRIGWLFFFKFIIPI